MRPVDQALFQVGRLIAEHPHVTKGTFWLCIDHRRLAIYAYKPQSKRCFAIARLSPADLNSGPSSNKWDYINHKLRDLESKGELPWPAPQP